MGKFFRKLLEVIEYAEIADKIGIDFPKEKFTLAQFSKGLSVEFKEHGPSDPQTNVIGDSKLKAGKVALAHLKERPDYYEKLAEIENG